jgi:hypothetical protein
MTKYICDKCDQDIAPLPGNGFNSPLYKVKPIASNMEYEVCQDCLIVLRANFVETMIPGRGKWHEGTIPFRLPST